MFMQKLSPYHYPSHVLFQFILANFLKVQRVTKKLQSIHHQIQSLVTTETLHSQEIKIELFSTTEELVGPASFFHSHFAWTPSQGILTILKNNSFLFDKAFAREYPEATLIKNQAAKSLSYGIKIHEISSYFLDAATITPASVEKLHRAEFQFTRILKQLSSAIAKAIPRFKDNENVVLCLLQQQQELDAFYGTAFTYKIIKKMYRNLNEAHTFLINAYTQREFKELLPEITRHIHSLCSHL